MECLSVRETVSVEGRNFQVRCCAKFGCSEERFTEEVFWRTLYPHALRPARMLWARNPNFFKRDFELIGLLRDATSCEEMRNVTEAFREHVPPHGLLQERFRIRISGRRLLRLGKQVFARTRSVSDEKRQ